MSCSERNSGPRSNRTSFRWIGFKVKKLHIFGTKPNRFPVFPANSLVVSTPTMAVIFNVDQPLTKHDAPFNPAANVSVGLEIATSSHAFQIFIGNYRGIIPQENHMYNPYEWTDGFVENFSLGFNITRLWNF